MAAVSVTIVSHNPETDYVLPMDLLVIASAEQNFERDCRKGIVDFGDWGYLSSKYIQEALQHIQYHNRNTPPEYPDHKQLCLQGNWDMNYPLITAMSQQYCKMLDVWYRESFKTLANWNHPINYLSKPKPEYYLHNPIVVFPSS